jgi:hypothetical protein
VATLLDEPRAASQVAGVLRAVVAGIGAAVAGLAVVAALVLVGWAVPGNEAGAASLLDALRLSGLGWIAAHHVPVLVPTGVLAWLPLGLLAVPLTAAYSAGQWVSRRASPASATQLALRTAAMSLTYAALATAVAVLTSGEEVRVVPVVTAAVATCLSAAAGSVGMWRAGSCDVWLWRRIPAAARASIAAGAAGAFTLMGAGALLVITAVVVRRAAIGDVLSALDAGLVGSVLLLVLSAVYLPNVVIWAVAYALGPGFAFGAGTSVTPLGVEVGPLPALALLGALPRPGEQPLLVLLVFLVPAAAGIVVGRVLARRLPTLGWTAVPWAFAASGVAGLTLGVLAVLSGGPLGGGRLAVIGPSPWQVAVAATLELALVAAPTAWLGARRGS